MFIIGNQNISKLDLSNQNLSGFPKEILELKNLKSLKLNNNQIKIIPTDIHKLKNLHTLDISSNNITNIYAKLCTLKRLQILNLNNNKIKNLPVQFENLQNLKSLHLSNNLLTSVPHQIYTLKKLRELDLSNNQIKTLDDDIKDLQVLRKIWLNNLSLNYFPKESIAKLKSLSVIYCFGKLNKDDGIDLFYKDLLMIKGNAKQNFLNMIEDEKIQNLIVAKKTNINSEANLKNNQSTKNKVFISYSHKDRNWLERVKILLNGIEIHLKKKIEIWDDTKLKLGDKWKQEIEKALSESTIAIILVSADFLASDFIHKEEIPQILDSASKKGTKILPIIVGPCLFKKSYLSEYQALNDPNIALSSISSAQAENYLSQMTEQVLGLLE